MKKIFVSGVLFLSVAAVCATQSNVPSTFVYKANSKVRDTIPTSPSKTLSDTLYNKKGTQKSWRNNKVDTSGGTWKRADTTGTMNSTSPNSSTTDTTRSPQ